MRTQPASALAIQKIKEAREAGERITFLSEHNLAGGLALVARQGEVQTLMPDGSWGVCWPAEDEVEEVATDPADALCQAMELLVIAHARCSAVLRGLSNG